MDRSRIGYEYSYGFSLEDDIIPLYEPCRFIYNRIDGLKIYLFEIRTNFKLKRVDHGDDNDGQMTTTTTTTTGSERFGAALQEDDEDGEWFLGIQTRFRLKDYWMSDDEIQSLARHALDFAEQRAAAAGASLSVIPVVVGLDVWTVQQEGEPVDAAIERAIKPDCLMPLYLWSFRIPEGSMQFDDTPYLSRGGFLMDQPRIRVEDEATLAGMEACPVCSRNFTVGAQVSSLPCRHTCHSLCVFNWLYKRNYSCPSCGVRIPTDSERWFPTMPPIDLD